MYPRSFSGTRWVPAVSSIAAYLDFTSRSSDYVVSLFSTKLTVTIITLVRYTKLRKEVGIENDQCGNGNMEVRRKAAHRFTNVPCRQRVTVDGTKY